MWNLIAAFREWHLWSGRKRNLATRARSVLAGGGGEARRVRSIGFVLRSPFRGLGGRPVYLKLECDYPDDRGCWLVRALDDGSEQWVWKSDYGKCELPPSAPAAARVDNRVIILPFLVTILLWLLGIGGFVAALLWL